MWFYYDFNPLNGSFSFLTLYEILFFLLTAYIPDYVPHLKRNLSKSAIFEVFKFEMLFGGGKHSITSIRVMRPFLPACPWSCICNFCLDNVLAISTAHFTMLVCMQIHFGINRHKIEIGYFWQNPLKNSAPQLSNTGQELKSLFISKTPWLEELLKIADWFLKFQVVQFKSF